MTLSVHAHAFLSACTRVTHHAQALVRNAHGLGRETVVEWDTAVAGGSAADAFLGTQGDVWDTQWGMLFALVGAVVSQMVFRAVMTGKLKRCALQYPKSPLHEAPVAHGAHMLRAPGHGVADR